MDYVEETQRGFVIEAVLIAVFGKLVNPGKQVEYYIPYSSLMELYELRSDASQPIMTDHEDELHVRKKLDQLIEYFEEPLNKKKIERALKNPWCKSPPLILNEFVSIIIVNALENAQYGEVFDPIETELILTAIQLERPFLTDQFELTDKIVDQQIPVQVYDIEDFEFALEGGIV